MIESKMGFYPCIKNQQTRECEYKNTDLYLEFGILKNGQLQFIDFRRSSGFPAYDDNSATAVKLAAPFPVPPVSMLASMKQGSTGIAIVGHVIYTYEVTLRGVLR